MCILVYKRVIDMNLFEWLIKQHYTDLQKSVPYIKNGVVLSPEGEPFEEENERYHGALYLANGGALLEKLKVKGLVKERDISKVVGSIPTIEDFLGYLRKYQKKDGVFGVDREEHKIVRIRYVVNSDDSVTKEFEMIPDDFMSYDGSIPIDEIGTKTRLAIMLPQVI